MELLQHSLERNTTYQGSHSHSTCTNLVSLSHGAHLAFLSEAAGRTESVTLGRESRTLLLSSPASAS